MFKNQVIISDADFCVKLAKNVFWVPVNSLGKPVITFKQILKILKGTPKEKQNSISNVFDAIRLFRLSHFKTVFDNIEVSENNVIWEHHKPGYYSVLTNEGCCASTSSWLNYIIEGNYANKGIFVVVRADATGHSYNYIKQGDWYYFIDLQPFLDEFILLHSIESGNIKDYKKAKFFTGFCVKAKSIQDYTNFFNRLLILSNQPKFFFFSFEKESGIPCGSDYKNGIIKTIFPNNVNIALYQYDNNLYNHQYHEAPRNIPKWNQKN